MKTARIVGIAFIFTVAVLFPSCSSKRMIDVKNEVGETGIVKQAGQKENSKNSCTKELTEETGNVEKPLTLEHIKNGYTGESIINITEYKGRYALVEYQRENFASRFDLYDLFSGERNQMITGGNYVSLLNLANENEIYFLSNGKNDINYSVVFPKIIKCSRNDKDNGNNADFKTEELDYYAKISQQTDFGTKVNTILYELKPTPNGFLAYFKPMPGVNTEGAFYVDYTDIPVTHAYLNTEDSTFNFEFKKTIFDDKYNISRMITYDKNQYINYLEMSYIEGNCKISISLKKGTREYTVKTKFLEDECYLPYAEVIFR